MEASRVANGAPMGASLEEPESPGTIRLGAIEVGLPPNPEQPMSVIHYINQNRATLWNVAKTFYMGRLVPSAILKMNEAQDAIAAVFTILSTGLELGLGYASALRSIYIVEGRATLSSDLMRALAIQAGCQFRYLKRNESECEIEVSRGGHKIGVGKFTIAQAQTANLLGKDNWKKYPEAMLAARAGAIAARMGAPDRLAGLYTPEEVEEELRDSLVAIDTAKDAAVGAAMREDQEARAATVATQFPAAAPSPAAAAPTRAGDPPRAGQSTPEQRQKIGILARAVGRAAKEDRVNPATGAVEPRTVVKTNDAMNKALGLPEGENAAIAYLTAGQCVILIDLLMKEEAQIEERRYKEQEQRDVDDAAEALGG